MAQLILKHHTARHNALLRLHRLASIALVPSSPPPPEVMRRSWQAQLLYGSLAIEYSFDGSQKISNSSGQEPKTNDNPYDRTFLRNILQDDIKFIKESGGQPSDEKSVSLASSLLQKTEEKGAVQETGIVPGRGTVGADLERDAWNSVRSQLKRVISQIEIMSSRNVLVRSSKEDTKTIETRQISSHGPVSQNCNNPLNGSASSGIKNDSKNQWVRILSMKENLDNGKANSAYATSGCQLPQDKVYLKRQAVEKREFVNDTQGSHQQTKQEHKSASLLKSSFISSHNSKLPHTVNESLKEEFGKRNDADFQSQLKSDKHSSVHDSRNGHHGTSQKPLNVQSGSRTTVADGGFTVCVEQWPPHIELSRVVGLLSLYGDVVSSFNRMKSDGISACFIKFKTDEAKEKALAARCLYIDGEQLPIKRVDPLMTTVVRITNASPETTDNKVLFACESYGEVDELKRRGRCMFDVYFKTRELPHMLAILDSLNNVTLDRRKWKALPAPFVHPQEVEGLFKRRGGLSWYFSQQVSALNKMEEAIHSIMLDLHDIRGLMKLLETPYTEPWS